LSSEVVSQGGFQPTNQQLLIIAWILPLWRQKLNYQRVSDATVKKPKIPFAVSGTDLSDLERFQILWAADLDPSLKKVEECGSMLMLDSSCNCA